MSCHVIVSAHTFAGRRSYNEDAYVIDVEGGLFAVADGMGGYHGGEIASHLAVSALAEFWAQSSDADATWPYPYDRSMTLQENRIAAAVRLANRRICEQREGDLRNMGSTLAAVAIHRNSVIVAHLGDSRVYRLRHADAGPQLSQLTRDHSLYEHLLATGVELPPLDAFPHANVIMRALGVEVNERPELHTFDLQDGDVYLLCSDGLTGPLGPERLTELLVTHPIEQVADQLVEAAYAAGSHDNITVIAIQVQCRPQ